MVFDGDTCLSSGKVVCSRRDVIHSRFCHPSSQRDLNPSVWEEGWD